ncbi:hypothetical protein Agub_g12095 [Astrephomene gubernaculifera]|uniref:Uncharacterized protein n=1 Tax=Astrephomene gubernaculifera TaxID=47775 RepID=A0AAD3HRA8_9CHLO|nr:hypothetical protein Agub_g12095 [Astrephomene gubernaculifera]
MAFLGTLTSFLLLFTHIIHNARAASIHPLCGSNITIDNVQPVAKSVTDLTALFHGLELPEGACIFNPALVQVSGPLYCLFGRIYEASEPGKRCAPGRMDRPPFLDGWRGKSTNILAILWLRQDPNRRRLQTKLMGHTYINASNHEDGRLFKDSRGRIYVYLALPIGVYPKRAVINTVNRVFIQCNRSSSHCAVSLGYPRILSFLGSDNAMDKNWVPWNGSEYMSFSHYGTFGPHSVFNWGSYDEPVLHIDFDSVAEDSLFPNFNKHYGHLLQLSGGSPVVLEPGGKSYLGVGHFKAHPGCFHPEAMPAWVDKSRFGHMVGQLGTNCAHLQQSSNETTRSEVLRVAFNFLHEGKEGIHYPLDYGFFFYRFNAAAPHNITHISHGVIPYTWRNASDHQGIVFPTGLERLGSDTYIIAYGDEDQASKLMTISARRVEALLWPLPKMEQSLDTYTVCAIGCEGEEGGRCSYE